MFGIDDWILATAATSLVSGIGNAIEGSTVRDDQERKIRKAQEQIRSTIIDDGELSLMLNNTERLFNNRLISTLNTTALRSRGFANAGVIGAAVAGGLEGEKLNAKQSLSNNVLQHNTGAYGKLAELELGMPSGSTAGDFATGFVGGIPTGIEISKLLGGLSSLNKIPGVVPNEGTDIINNAQTEDIDITNTNAEPVSYHPNTNNSFGENTSVDYGFPILQKRIPNSFVDFQEYRYKNKRFNPTWPKYSSMF